MASDIEIEAAQKAFLKMCDYVERNADLRAMSDMQKMRIAVELGIPAALNAAECARLNAAR